MVWESFGRNRTGEVWRAAAVSCIVNDGERLPPRFFLVYMFGCVSVSLEDLRSCCYFCLKKKKLISLEILLTLRECLLGRPPLLLLLLSEKEETDLP